MSDYETTEEQKRTLSAAIQVRHGDCTTAESFIPGLVRDYARSKAEIERLRAALHAARDALKYGIAPAARHEAVAVIDAALSGKGEL